MADIHGNNNQSRTLYSSSHTGRDMRKSQFYSTIIQQYYYLLTDRSVEAWSIKPDPIVESDNMCCFQSSHRHIYPPEASTSSGILLSLFLGTYYEVQTNFMLSHAFFPFSWDEPKHLQRALHQHYIARFNISWKWYITQPYSSARSLLHFCPFSSFFPDHYGSDKKKKKWRWLCSTLLCKWFPELCNQDHHQCQPKPYLWISVHRSFLSFIFSV